MLVAPLLALTMATLASASAVKRAAPVPRGNYQDSNLQPVTYRGCYPDNANSRTLSIAAPSSAPPGGSMTVEGCAFACASAKYPVSGTEFGGQCFCAQAMPSVAALADDSLCNSYCNGDTVHQCGGTNTLSIYSQELLTDKPNNAPTSAIVSYKGCGTTASTSGVTAYSTLSTATVDSCADVAIAGGYAFFAVNGQACTLYQADPAPTTGATCGTTCPGNNLKFCGDSTSGALNFYAVASPNLPASQRPTTITTTNTAATFTYQGCYTDGSSLRTLPSGIPMSNITPQKCAEACSAAGFIYAGLEYGAECWCGNTIRTGATLYPTLTNAPSIQPNCIMPCAGDATKPCGGGNAIQIWLTTAWAGFPSAAQVSLLAAQYKSEAVSYYGCFQDDSSSDTKRIFPLRLYPVGQMTPQLCSISCSQYVAVDTSGVPINYLYSGLQYGSECWCNFVPPSQTKAISQVQCTAMKCAGDANSWCGGGNIMTVYSAVAPSAATAVASFPGFTSLGCGSSFSSLYTYTPSATNFKLTVEFCATACKAQGFTHAALSTPTAGNNQCDCGTAASFAAPLTATTCTSACTGGTGKQLCGGTSSFSIYGTGANGLQQVTGATTKSFAASAAIPAAVYLGCYVDSTTSRRLEIKAVNVDTINLTPSKCVAACSAMGLRYAGVEYGSECWCSNTAPPAWTGGQSTSDRAIFGKYDDCSMACSGATGLACGAGNRISIYSNGGATVANSGTASTTTLSNGYVYQGCAADQYPTGRVLRTEISVSSNSPLACSSACATLGYVYAGVEFGTQCFCASSFTGTFPGNIEASCNMPCPGSTTQFCGGSNFLNVYYNANIARTTLQSYQDTTGKTWTYKSCWGEPVDANGQHGSSRALNFPLNNNQLNTVESCLEMGAAAGYTMCGLEYGGECWCNNNPSTGNPSGGGAVPDSYCNTPCAGKIGNNCGGNYVLSVYARPS